MIHSSSIRCIVSAALVATWTLSGCAIDPRSDSESVGTASQAVVTGDTGFVWAQSSTGSYDADPAYSVNSAGGTNHITRFGTGSYHVDFPGLGTDNGGNVQVTSYGSDNQRCLTSNWMTVGTTLEVTVYCYTTGGQRADGRFTASFQRRSGVLGQQGGYVVGDQPTNPSPYIPDLTRQWNSAGGNISIARATPGNYKITFPGQGITAAGTVEVTSMGGAGRYCKAETWFPTGGDETVLVTCFDATGGPVDTPFSAVFSQRSPNNTISYSYGLADQPSVAHYNANFQYGSVAGCLGDQQTTSPITIDHGITGMYTVHFPQMVSTGSARTNVKVTNAGFLTGTCKVQGWGDEAGGAFAVVSCFSASGAPVDEYFNITFSSTLFTPVVC